MPSANTKRVGTIRTHLIAGVAAAIFLALGVGGWAATTELAGAVVAPGTVVVNSAVKKIQHPIGGIIKELLVKDGDLVHAGQVMVRLDDTQARANLSIHVKRNDELIARLARHEAELSGAERIAFPPQLTDRAKDPGVAFLMATQERLLTIRRTSRDNEKAQLRERVNQLRQKVIGIEAQTTAKVAEIDW